VSLIQRTSEFLQQRLSEHAKCRTTPKLVGLLRTCLLLNHAQPSHLALRFHHSLQNWRCRGICLDGTRCDGSICLRKLNTVRSHPAQISLCPSSEPCSSLLAIRTTFFYALNVTRLSLLAQCIRRCALLEGCFDRQLTSLIGADPRSHLRGALRQGHER
jgi:hypothetical protein